MIPTILFTLSLVTALCVQTMVSPLAGAWFFFFLCACACTYRPPENRDPVWRVCVAWLLTLGISTFLLRPVANGAASMWMLAAMPLLVLSLRKEYLRKYLLGALAVITLYSVGLILQMLFQVHYTHFDYELDWRNSSAAAWPMLDPNNAAAVINCALIPCFYLALRDKRWFAFVAVFLFALFATASKAGGLAFTICAIILLGVRFTAWITVLGLLSMIPFYSWVDKALAYRYPIWKAALPLLTINPYTGLGLGTFGQYYAQIRTENGSGGWFAHNDFLQLGIEIGFPCVLVFCLLWLTVAIETNSRNIVFAVTMMAVILQSLVEFQFYVPVISILMGLLLYCHFTYGNINNRIKPI